MSPQWPRSQGKYKKLKELSMKGEIQLCKVNKALFYIKSNMANYVSG